MREGQVVSGVSHICLGSLPLRDRVALLWHGRATFEVRVLVGPTPETTVIRTRFAVGHVEVEEDAR